MKWKYWEYVGNITILARPSVLPDTAFTQRVIRYPRYAKYGKNPLNDLLYTLNQVNNGRISSNYFICLRFQTFKLRIRTAYEFELTRK